MMAEIIDNSKQELLTEARALVEIIQMSAKKTIKKVDSINRRKISIQRPKCKTTVDTPYSECIRRIESSCLSVKMGFVGNCPVHCIFIGGIETSCRDNFTKYWPSLLKGYSFACHDHICTCGVLTKPIRKRHKLGRVKCRYHATCSPPTGEKLEEDDGFENIKNMRRIGYRRKKKDKKS